MRFSQYIQLTNMWMSWPYNSDLRQNHVITKNFDLNIQLQTFLHQVMSTSARDDLHFSINQFYICQFYVVLLFH